MAKKTAKRYSDEEKKTILDFIEAQGRGGQTKAVKKFKVTPATLSAWKKKAGGGGSVKTSSSGASKELKALAEMASLLKEISATEAKLVGLNKRYKILKKSL